MHAAARGPQRLTPARARALAVAAAGTMPPSTGKRWAATCAAAAAAQQPDREEVFFTPAAHACGALSSAWWRAQRACVAGGLAVRAVGASSPAAHPLEKAPSVALWQPWCSLASAQRRR